jgi:hypothetical protein
MRRESTANPVPDGLVVTEAEKGEDRARARLKALERARAAKVMANARRRDEIVREELSRERAKDCHCAIPLGATAEQLRSLGAGCTAGRWVCPTLDAIRRRLGT